MNNNSVHTEKELMLIKDELDAESLSIKKLNDYKNDVGDPEILTIMDTMIQKHKDHYNRLLNHLR